MPKRPEVERWLARYENPMKPVVMRLRDVVLATDPRVDECIKWQAPTFTFQGNIASFYPKSKAHASLMFHQGAKIPGKHPRLEGSGGTSRVLKLASVAEVNAAKKDVQAIVRAWIAWKSDAGPVRAAKATKKAASKRSAKKKSVAKKKTVTKKKTAKKKSARR